MSDEPRRVERTVGDTRTNGWRIDQYLSEEMGLFSRSQARLRVTEARVNGRPAKLSRRLKAGDRLEVSYRTAPRMELVPEDIPVAVLYEDERIIVVDKPQGLVVHPACGHPGGTLVNALLWRWRALPAAFPAQDLRPGVVHRLDKDTSGVMVVAKDPEGHEALARQFKARQVRKLYLAVVHGAPPDAAGVVQTHIARDPRDRKRFAVTEAGGKPALTRYRVLRALGDYVLVAFRPVTGRTHQIRVHARHLGCPVVGDPIYGRGDPGGATLMLHAYRLRLVPPGQSAPVTFTAPLPERFRALISRARDVG